MRKKGVALLWTLVLSAVLLIISSTMVSYIIKESRFSVNIEESTVAYAAAKSGLEWGLHEIDKPGTPASSKNLDLINTGDTINDTTVVINSASGACSGGTLITSESVSGVVTRKLEYCFTKTKPNIISVATTPGDTILDSTGNFNSFEMSFDFWFSTGSNTNGYLIGVDDSSLTPLRFIRARINSVNVVLEASNGVKTETATVTQSLLGTTDPYGLRGTIKYIEDTAARLTIERRRADGSYACIATTTLDLNGFLTNENLNSLNVGGVGTAPALGNDPIIGDGSYLFFGGPTYKTIYVDNIVFEN